jgi:hypothetical protein
VLRAAHSAPAQVVSDLRRSAKMKIPLHAFPASQVVIYLGIVIVFLLNPPLGILSFFFLLFAALFFSLYTKIKNRSHISRLNLVVAAFFFFALFFISLLVLHDGEHSKKDYLFSIGFIFFIHLISSYRFTRCGHIPSRD